MKECERKVLVVIPLNLDGLSGERGVEERQGHAGAVAAGGGLYAQKFDAQVENVIRALRADDGGSERSSERNL